MALKAAVVRLLAAQVVGTGDVDVGVVIGVVIGVVVEDTLLKVRVTPLATKQTYPGLAVQLFCTALIVVALMMVNVELVDAAKSF